MNRELNQRENEKESGVGWMCMEKEKEEESVQRWKLSEQEYVQKWIGQVNKAQKMGKYAKDSEQSMQDSYMTSTERKKPARQGLSEVYIL